MTFNISVKGGTHAGWRRTNQPRLPWICKCGANNARYLLQCGECNQRAARVGDK